MHKCECDPGWYSLKDLNSTGYEQFGVFHYGVEVTGIVNPYGPLHVDGDERMIETDLLGARILIYDDTQTPKFKCRLIYDAHCKNCTACLDNNGPIEGCVPGCKVCDKGYFLTNRTENGRCEACHLNFPHCQTCERVFTTRGVESEAVRCTLCDPLFVLHDGECVSDGVFEFESPRYHVYQDEAYIDVYVVRNL
ncbi:unnamed protein product, partial [Amoebophrya sp. A25]|eukprot:GSA25T00021240001.1